MKESDDKKNPRKLQGATLGVDRISDMHENPESSRDDTRSELQLREGSKRRPA